MVLYDKWLHAGAFGATQAMPSGVPCRSELARDGPENAAFIHSTRIIVNVYREQARSYRVIP
ncbi:hypothetical protein BK636_14640 [Pseudomonas chlororaphis]|nr:hypothetical protein BK636_14640 [Pseudomonas chlororaphis]